MNCRSCEHLDLNDPIDDEKWELFWCFYHGCYKDPSSICAWYSCDNYKDR